MTNHPNRATTYTVLNGQGSIVASGCTVSDAAAELLTYDGYAYEVRRTERYYDDIRCWLWELWHSDGSAASPRGAGHMVRTMIFVYAPTEDEAWLKIAREVIKHSGWFKGCDCMPDTEYDDMLAELADE